MVLWKNAFYFLRWGGIVNNIKIVVADSGDKSRKIICDLLTKKGYQVYKATDGAGALRICRSVFPDLVIMDTNLWGINAYEVARIIEQDRLSSVIFTITNANAVFYEKLKNMNIFAYILKPINLDQLYHTVEFSINNSKKIRELKKKVEKLENTLEGRKKVDRAKGIIMKKLNVSEDEAYQWLRKKSMDKCASIDKIAEIIIEKYS